MSSGFFIPKNKMSSGLFIPKNKMSGFFISKNKMSETFVADIAKQMYHIRRSFHSTMKSSDM
jgi:hypothetical protein